MNCPDCGNIRVCPCKACRSRQPDKTPWTSVDEDSEACSQCGVVRPMNEWLNISYEQYEKAKEG